DRTPEAVQIIHRPAPQVLVTDHVLARALVRELGEVMDLRTRCLIGVRAPDRFSGQFFSSAQHNGGQQWSSVSSAGRSGAPAGETVTQPYPDIWRGFRPARIECLFCPGFLDHVSQGSSTHTPPGGDSNLRPPRSAEFPSHSQLPSAPVVRSSTAFVSRLSGALRVPSLGASESMRSFPPSAGVNGGVFRPVCLYFLDDDGTRRDIPQPRRFLPATTSSGSPGRHRSLGWSDSYHRLVDRR